MGAAPSGVVGDISVSTTTTDQAKLGGDVGAGSQISGLGAGSISAGTPSWVWIVGGAFVVLAVLAAMLWPKKKGGR